MKHLVLPALCLASLSCAHQRCDSWSSFLGCAENRSEVLAPDTGQSIHFPQFFASAPVVVGADGGMFELNDALIQALQVASDDFLPHRTTGRPCAAGRPAYKYRVQRSGDVIFVAIYEDPAACGLPYVTLDSGAHYAISTDGRILRRDGDALEGIPSLPDGGVPGDASQLGTSSAPPARGDYWVEWSLDGGRAAPDAGQIVPDGGGPAPSGR